MNANIPSKIRPMKPVKDNADFAILQYPVGVTSKKDGIRFLNTKDGAQSASGKKIPNHHIRRFIETHLPIGLDGEIMLQNSKATFQEITSAVMSEWSISDFKLWIFDDFSNPDWEYLARIQLLNLHAIAKRKIKSKLFPKRYNFLFPKICYNAFEVKKYLKFCLKMGDEGIIIRNLKAPYKFGRSAPSEGGMYRYKPFVDGEAEIVDFYEQETNCNIAKTSELGFTKRSSARAGKVGKDTLGGFTVRDLKTKAIFNIGTGQGLTLKKRKEIWNKKWKYVHEIIKYKKQLAGEKDKPRTPIFMGFRDKRDLTDY